MRFWGIVRFELAYQARRVWPWLIFVAIVVISFLLSQDTSVESALYEDLLANSTFGIAKSTVIGGLFWLLAAAVIAGDAASRDLATGMHPLTWTAPVRKLDYLGGRFFAAFAINALILLGVQGGIVLGIYSSGLDAAAVGPFRPAAFLTAYFFLAIPNALAATAIQFALALRTGKAMTAYLGSLLIVFTGFFIGGLVYWFVRRAAEYVEVIRGNQRHGPYHLGGWSMGGVIALEMAQQLFADGEEVGFLLLLDTAIPYNEANRRYAGDEDLSWQEYGLDKNLEELAKLGPDEQLPYLWDHAKKLGVVDRDAPLPLVQRMLDDLKRLFHAHIELGNAYVVRPYPGQITLFRPLDAPVRVPLPEDRGWRQLARAVEVHFVPGQHHSMVQEPHVHVLAERLRASLEAGPLARGVSP